MNLKKERKKIDTIDRKIMLLLSKRIKTAKKLKKLKKQQSLKITSRAREKEVIENARLMAKHHDLEPKFAEELFRKIIKYTREKQK